MRTTCPPRNPRSRDRGIAEVNALRSPHRARAVLVEAIADAYGDRPPALAWRIAAQELAAIAETAGLTRDARRFRRLARRTRGAA